MFKRGGDMCWHCASGKEKKYELTKKFLKEELACIRRTIEEETESAVTK